MEKKRYNKKLYQITINVDLNSRLIGKKYGEVRGEYSLLVRKVTPKEDLFGRGNVMTPLYQKTRKKDKVKVSDLMEIKGQNKDIKRFINDYDLEDKEMTV